MFFPRFLQILEDLPSQDYFRGITFFSALHLLFNYLTALSLCCFVLLDFSSCGEQDLFFALVLGLLIEVASLVAEHRL